MTTKQPRDRESFPGKRALNQHFHLHHDRYRGRGDLIQRLEAHDELHWRAAQEGVDLGHTHLPYQEGETDNEMAARMLADGMAQQSPE